MLDYFGFGKFQWTITFISGVAWVWNLSFIRRRAQLSRVSFPRQAFTVCAASAGAGWRRHGDCYPEHLVLTAALRVEAGQLSGGSHVIGKKTDSTGMFGESWRTSRFFPLLAECVSRHRDRLPYLGDLLRQVRQKNRECPTCPVSCWFPACFNVWTLWKTGSDPFLLLPSVFRPAERLCSRLQLVDIPTLPRRL